MNAFLTPFQGPIDPAARDGGASQGVPKVDLIPYEHTKAWFDALWQCDSKSGLSKDELWYWLNWTEKLTLHYYGPYQYDILYRIDRLSVWWEAAPTVIVRTQDNMPSKINPHTSTVWGFTQRVACVTHYFTCMPHIDHMRRLDIDPGLSRIPIKYAI